MSVEFLIASAIAALVAGGTWLVLRARTFQVVLGLTLLSYAVNLFLFAAGRLVPDSPPIYDPAITDPADPLPQALVLTAIVITFGLSAFLLALAYRSWQVTHDDEVEDDLEDRRIARLRGTTDDDLDELTLELEELEDLAPGPANPSRADPGAS